MKAIFTDYVLIKRGPKKIFRASLEYRGADQISNMTLTAVLSLIIPLFIYYWPLNVPSFIRFVLIIITLAGSYIVVKRYIMPYVFATSLLTINTEKKTLETTLEKFHTPLSEIKKIALIEETLQGDELDITIYKLKLFLVDGPKTLGFAFTSYNKIDEILKEIERSLELDKTPTTS